jgi:hypothetical protein
MVLGLTQPLTEMNKGKGKAIPLQALKGPWGFQEIKAPRF